MLTTEKARVCIILLIATVWQFSEYTLVKKEVVLIVYVSKESLCVCRSGLLSHCVMLHTCLKSCFDSLCQQRILMCLQIRFTVWCNSESGWGGTLSSPEHPVLWQPVFLRHVHRGSGWIQVWLHHITRNRPKGIIIINRLHLHIRNSGHWGKCTSKSCVDDLRKYSFLFVFFLIVYLLWL